MGRIGKISEIFLRPGTPAAQLAGDAPGRLARSLVTAPGYRTVEEDRQGGGPQRVGAPPQLRRNSVTLADGARRAEPGPAGECAISRGVKHDRHGSPRSADAWATSLP